ncbi:MAG: HesA/MoeB/ThiF family protein [Elusimicrobiota bacterium]
MDLTKTELLRYDRQMLLDPIGAHGQQRLKTSKVLIAGMGGLGCPAALYLASAGVGHLTLVDYDRVEMSNLHRQILFTDSDISSPKVLTAAKRLRRINPHIHVDTAELRIDAATASGLISNFDVVLDATDDPLARYALNDACVATGIPVVYGSVYGFEGRVAVFGSDGGGCLRCLWPEPPQEDLRCDCSQAGTLGAITGIIGSYQALETIKVLTQANHLKNRLLIIDALGAISRTMSFSRNPSCDACSAQNLSERAASRLPTLEIAPEILATLLDSATPPILVDVRETIESQAPAALAIRHLPLSQLTRWSADLDKTTRIITVCDSGVKSRWAARALQELGFDAKSLNGGLDSPLAISLHLKK